MEIIQFRYYELRKKSWTSGYAVEINGVAEWGHLSLASKLS